MICHALLLCLPRYYRVTAAGNVQGEALLRSLQSRSGLRTTATTAAAKVRQRPRRPLCPPPRAAARRAAPLPRSPRRQPQSLQTRRAPDGLSYISATQRGTSGLYRSRITSAWDRHTWNQLPEADSPDSMGPVQVAEVTEAVKEAKDAKKEVAVELEKGADTVVRSPPPSHTAR